MTKANDNTTRSDPEPVDTVQYIRQLMAKEHKIAIIWRTDDVRGIRPDLSEDQAWEVLQQAEDIHDAQWGICWSTLETVADDLFPEPTDAAEKPHGN